MNIVLWILQIMLALLFLFAGITKLVLPAEVLQSAGSPNAIKFSALFLKFIGVLETLGGLGLILPGIFHRQQYLTPLAAAGLVVIMIGAVITTIMGDGVSMIFPPVVIGLVCAFVAYARWKVSPLR